MNSNKNREWELYNFNNVGNSTEYDNLLINKDIDNYFNDIISKPITVPNTNPIKSNYNFNKFYKDYIEHNLIFIVVLVGIIIFLIIRYYVKDYDNYKIDENNKIENNKMFNKEKTKNKKYIDKFKNKSKKLEIERNKLINYKIELDREKQQILSIIDELSNINEFDNYNNYNIDNQIYLNHDINSSYSNNYNNNLNKYFSQMNNFYTKAHNDNDNGINLIPENDNTSNYYDINKKQDDKINEIDGLYIEPPFI